MTEQELREWFDGRQLPEGPIWIHKSIKVDDPRKFVDLHLSVISSRKDPKLNEPALLRLNQMKQWLEGNGHS